MKSKTLVLSCAPLTSRSSLLAYLVCVIYGSLALSEQSYADTSLAQHSTLTILRLDRDKNSNQIAEEYLGDKQDAWQITELNGRNTFKTGDIVALPVKPLNPTAVYTNHYRAIPILCYHQFAPGARTKNQLAVAESDFDQQMAYLVDNDYQVLTLNKLSDVLAGKTSIPPKSVVLTIDDGYRSVYDIAYPILKKYALSATLFVYTDFVGGGAALSWQQIKEMQDSGVINIESHTKTHSSLKHDTDAEDSQSHRTRVAGEIDLAGSAIKKNLGLSPRHLAYPYGDTSPDTIAYLKTSVNYALAATVRRGVNGAFADPFLLQRTMIYNNHSLADFKKMINSKKTY